MNYDTPRNPFNVARYVRRELIHKTRLKCFSDLSGPSGGLSFDESRIPEKRATLDGAARKRGKEKGRRGREKKKKMAEEEEKEKESASRVTGGDKCLERKFSCIFASQSRRTACIKCSYRKGTVMSGTVSVKTVRE